MSFRSIVASLAFAFATLQGTASAQTSADKIALAREMVVTLELEDTLNGLFETMTPLLAGSVSNEMRLSPSEEGRLTELLNEEFRNAMPEITQRVANTYADALTEQEMRDIIGFLQSPSGQAMRRTEEQVKGEMERVGAEVGMRVALQAMTRLMQERQQQRR